MTIAAAQKFILKAVQEPELVSRINAADDEAEIRDILSQEQFIFNHDEFEKAYFNVLTWCQTSEQAEVVEEIKMWWDYLGICLNRSENNSRSG